MILSPPALPAPSAPLDPAELDGCNICAVFGLGSSFALPFCTTACHTNSLVAVGDEEGCIRLLDTMKGKGDASVIRKPHLAFRPHQNAVLDMDFSEDDYHMATASGDQSSFIIDMRTQRSIVKKVAETNGRCAEV